MRKALLTTIVFFCMIGTALAIPIQGVYSTGVDDAGALLALGAVDQHYDLLGVNQNAYTTSGAYPNWVSSTSTSQWITVEGYQSTTSVWPSTAPAGYYNYQLTFDLSGFDPTTAYISGQWASDNNSTIYLNSVDTGYSLGLEGFQSLTSFSIANGFVDGINTLTFSVYNYPQATGNPTGLQVNILESDVVAAPVPEPATLLLLGTGLVGLAGAGRKKLFKK